MDEQVELVRAASPHEHDEGEARNVALVPVSFAVLAKALAMPPDARILEVRMQGPTSIYRPETCFLLVEHRDLPTVLPGWTLMEKDLWVRYTANGPVFLRWGESE